MFFTTADKLDEKRIILHIDFDAFFASCEEVRKKLKGKPVIVGALPKEGRGRGVVSTANYIARKYKIKSGMPISIAYRRCPHGVYLPVDMEYYQKVSENIMALIKNYSDKLEVTGIDECFLDLTSVGLEKAIEIARKIKKEIFRAEKITCSIGISSNKLVSKIASDFRKPDGLTIVRDSEKELFLQDLEVGKLPGVGPKTKAKLEEMGIKKIKEMRKFPNLEFYFGKSMAEYLKRVSYGLDDSEVSSLREKEKSIGLQVTFNTDIKNEEIILKRLDRLVKKVFALVLEKKFKFDIITIRLRYADFETHTKQKKTKFIITNVNEAINISRELVMPFLNSSKKVRLIGVSFSGFR